MCISTHPVCVCVCVKGRNYRIQTIIVHSRCLKKKTSLRHTREAGTAVEHRVCNFIVRTVRNDPLQTEVHEGSGGPGCSWPSPLSCWSVLLMEHGDTIGENCHRNAAMLFWAPGPETDLLSIPRWTAASLDLQFRYNLPNSLQNTSSPPKMTQSC